MAQTALGKVEPEVKRWVEMLAQQERYKQNWERYEKEKQVVRNAHSTWSHLNWKLTQEALDRDDLNLLLQVKWKQRTSDSQVVGWEVGHQSRNNTGQPGATHGRKVKTDPESVTHLLWQL